MAIGLDTLIERGFFKQCTNLEGLRKKMDEGPVTFYVGVDPTGSSLHVGHMVPFFAMHHLQQAGHNPIAVVGGGTSMIGDPSGKSEMRKMLSVEQIAYNADCIKKQLSTVVDFSDDSTGDGKAVMVNNYDWLGPLNYLEFLRDVGKHFSVNKMLSFETYKMRMETGLSFIEFNYQLLQSYDFLTLYRDYGCTLQMGGDDQWGNIVAGIDLTRRMAGAEVFGLTFPLVTRADGKKMGKTEKGAVFLDPEMFSPYDYFQYWRNVADADVEKFLLLFTFLPVNEIKELGKLEGQDINRAKEILAYEQTKIIHGKDEADKAREAARAAFSAQGIASVDKSAIPSITVDRSELESGINVMDLFARTALCSSKGEARRLVTQGGASINEAKISDIDKTIDISFLEDNELLLKAGKKRYFRIIIS
ncbi:MAG: tyrosine--tRNA ligase [Spirochaetaceae bacterium]|nr:tyrosine--tRNA ligase [Spirochaetaceae bacterium]